MPLDSIAPTYGHPLRAEAAPRPRTTTARSVGSITAKRVFDIIAASAALVALAPLFGGVALALKLRERGPVFYGHERVGRTGRRFACLKFRTMVTGGDAVLARHLVEHPAARAEWDATRKLHDDPRVTDLGRFLRQTSLDELPQLLNIIRGEMSIVGPRPVVDDELERYGRSAAAYLSVRPGLTGLWQVSGRSDTSYRQRITLDRHYAKHRSMMMDLLIIARTVPVVLSSDGSY